MAKNRSSEKALAVFRSGTPVSREVAPRSAPVVVYHGSGYRRHRRMNHAAMGVGLALVGAAAVVPNAHRLRAYCDSQSFCNASAANRPTAAMLAQIPHLPGHELISLDTSAVFPAAKDPSQKIDKVASYVVDPSLPILQTNGIGIGVKVVFNPTKFSEWQSTAINPDQVSGPQYVTYMAGNTDPAVKKACSVDLSQLTKKIVANAAEIVSNYNLPATAIQTAENSYTVAPYTNQVDNPDTPDLYVYSQYTIPAGQPNAGTHNGKLGCIALGSAQ